LFASGYSGYRLGTDDFVPKNGRNIYNKIIYIIYKIYTISLLGTGVQDTFSLSFSRVCGWGPNSRLYPVPKSPILSKIKRNNEKFALYPSCTRCTHLDSSAALSAALKKEQTTLKTRSAASRSGTLPEKAAQICRKRAQKRVHFPIKSCLSQHFAHFSEKLS
jgi:hypothetical protein